MSFEQIINGVRYRFAVINGERQDFYVNELGQFFHKNGKPKKISKPSGNEKYFTISCKKNGKKSKTSVHRCLQETFNGGAIEDKNWKNLRPDCFTKEQWMGFTEEQRVFLSRSGIHVDHKNGVKHDNDLSNLQYLWASDNIAKGNSSSCPIDQVRELVQKVCYVSPNGTLHGLSDHGIDLTSYENMVSFIREEIRYMSDPFDDQPYTKHEINRYVKMTDFLKKNKIAA